MAAMSTTFFLPIFFSLPHLLLAVQQSYPSTEHTMDCTHYHEDNAGYLCEPTSPICETLAYYHVQSGPFSSLNTIATKLFNTTPSAIADASGLSSSYDLNLDHDDGIYIPITCRCNGNFTFENTVYAVRPGDTFFQIANVTYEGLTTCQAMQDANPNVSVTELTVGQELVIPLRCACPSQEQTNRGIKLLATYPAERFGEQISSVTSKFNIEQQEFLAANNIINTSRTLYPSITVLIPFREKPKRSPEILEAQPQSSRKPRRKTLVVIAIAIAVVLSCLTLIAIAISCFANRAKHKSPSKRKSLLASDQSASSASSMSRPSFPLKDKKLHKDLVESISTFALYEKLASYSIDEIQQATQNFHPTRKIKGSVYRGTIKGRVIAIKGMQRDVSKELQILRKVHHMNLVSLLGVCIASPEQTYLVYEFAENGSLYDWLHGQQVLSIGSNDGMQVLTYRNRLRVALDVATAMEYIHDHTKPSFVHKDISTHNILLDARMRAKIANFALAKPLEKMEPETRHIVGTQGYMAPEYVMQGTVTPKMDVYAFGVVLLEMLSGEEALRRGGKGGKEMYLAEAIGPLLSGADARERLRAWIDPCLNGSFPLDCAYSVAILARSCVTEDPSARPNAREVAFTLSRLLESSQDSGILANYNPSIEAR
ncbi:hypothetical protein L7F22_060041 [Adiantum nelumboides]|nr:hypothetical protein [Adiantum nelumboides]